MPGIAAKFGTGAVRAMFLDATRISAAGQSQDPSSSLASGPPRAGFGRPPLRAFGGRSASGRDPLQGVHVGEILGATARALVGNEVAKADHRP